MRLPPSTTLAAVTSSTVWKYTSECMNTYQPALFGACRCGSHLVCLCFRKTANNQDVHAYLQLYYGSNNYGQYGAPIEVADDMPQTWQKAGCAVHACTRSCMRLYVCELHETPYVRGASAFAFHSR
jgi:hypothetical protein